MNLHQVDGRLFEQNIKADDRSERSKRRGKHGVLGRNGKVKGVFVEQTPLVVDRNNVASRVEHDVGVVLKAAVGRTVTRVVAFFSRANIRHHIHAIVTSHATQSIQYELSISLQSV